MSNRNGYEAFISYKHNPIDTKVAKDVQKRIEHYRIPKDIQKKTGIQKFRRVFRDTSELSGTADLPADIENAIKQSDYLIVICSQRTHESPWVVREIEMFLACHDMSHVLTVLVDGEPFEVIPKELLKETRKVVSPDGTVYTEERSLEPLSCDYRKKFRGARNQEILRLISRFLGCDYDELFKRDMRYRYRRYLTLFCIIMSLSIIATLYLLWSSHEIRKNYNESVRQKTMYAAGLGEQYLEDGRREAALKTGISSVAELTDDELLLAPELLNFMEEASRIYNWGYDGNFDNIVNTQEFLMEGSVSDLSTDDSGKYICCSDKKKYVYIWSVEQKRMIYKEPWNTHITDILLTAKEHALVAAESTVCCIDCMTGKTIWEQKYTSEVICLVESADSQIGILTRDSMIWVDLLTADIVEKAKLKDYIAEGTPLAAHEDITVTVDAESPNKQWLCLDMSLHKEIIERKHFRGVFDIQGHCIYILEEKAAEADDERDYNKIYITNSGDLYTLESSSSFGDCYISKISITDGVEWTGKWHISNTKNYDLLNGSISYRLPSAYLGVSEYSGMDSQELIVVIGSSALILDAGNGDTLNDVALPAEAMLYIGDTTYFLMSGMICYRNSKGDVYSGRFPVGNFDNYSCIEKHNSWTQTKEFVFSNGRNVYIYQEIPDNADVVRYETALENVSENAEERELLVTRDGLIEICIYESSSTGVCKYTSDNRECVWSADIPEKFEDIIGVNSSEEYLYLGQKSSTKEKKMTRIDLQNGDVITFVLPDRHYRTEPYELSSIKELFGAQKEDILFYSEWTENYKGYTYAICRYNAGSHELEEHALPFRLDSRFPGTVFSDDLLVCYSDQKELYVVNTDTWEIVILDDEYEQERLWEGCYVFSPRDGMYAVWSSAGNSLNLYSESSGKVYTVGSTSNIITACNDEDTLYVLYSNGTLVLYNLVDGNPIDSVDLNTSISRYREYNIKLTKISDNELVISCFEGVYVIDLSYKTIRTHVPAGIGYDEMNDGFYLGISDAALELANGAWVRRYSASEVKERVEQMVGVP